MQNIRRIVSGRTLVELDGDEMARVMWQQIKKKLILPNVDVTIKYFDLSAVNRDRTDDKVTVEAANSILEHGTAVKCATITIDQARVKELSLKRTLPSPNGTIRNILGGTVFREPIVCKNIPAYISHWKKPIVIARHAHADQYKATEMNVKEGQKLFLVSDDCRESNGKKKEVNDFHSGSGVGMATFNTEKSIEAFAHSCFRHALSRKLSLYFSTKNTILKKYDGYFKDIFSGLYEKEYAKQFKEEGLSYEHRLIDDMAAFCIRSDGGFMWACKNYDGDVMSDVIAQGFGSLGLMTSVLLTPDGKIMESEAAHGTVTRHFRQYQKGIKTSTNPVASIFAWTRGLKHMANLERNKPLSRFCSILENACIESIEQGVMTKDLLQCVQRSNNTSNSSKSHTKTFVTMDDFIDHVAQVVNRELNQKQNI